MTTNKRKSISKKMRFDVFKRDGFVCQYCGSHPPSVILHVDHIHPVSKGGKNHSDNLITACESCNLGKGAEELTVIPGSLEDRAAEVLEREAQIKGFNKVLEAKRERLRLDTWRVMAEIYPHQDSVSKSEFQTVKTFIDKLGLHEVLGAAETSMGDHVKGAPFKYFCGICWNKIREAA